MIKQDFIPVNPYSRIGRKMLDVWGIAMHYGGSPRATAQNTRDYFASLAKKKSRKAGAHAAVDERGTIQMAPWDEEMWHIGLARRHWHRYSELASKVFHNHPSKYLIGIEMMHPDITGKFLKQTIYQAKELCATLCAIFDLDPTENIIRHYDCTGKNCPKWWVAHPEEFEEFRLAVKKTIEYRDIKDLQGGIA